MAFIKTMEITDLGTGALFSLWGIRALTVSGEKLIDICRAFDRMFGANAPNAWDDLKRLTEAIRAATKRNVQIAPTTSRTVSADELSLIALLAAAQDDDYNRLDAHLCWLLRSSRNEDVALAAVRFAMHVSAAGWKISAPEKTHASAHTTTEMSEQRIFRAV